MKSNKKRKCYIVIEGWNRGIYDNWDECKEEVDRFPKSFYKGFTDTYEALAYLEENMDDCYDYTISLNGVTEHYDTYNEFMTVARDVLKKLDMIW